VLHDTLLNKMKSKGGMSLKKKATRGSIWVSLTRMGINVIDFVVYAYLARVLSLEEFGLVGFCFLFIEFANSLVNAGINQNIVQRKDWSDDYAASTMTFVSFIGFMVACALIFIGAPIASFTYSDLAAYVIASLAPITIIVSFQVVVAGKLIREFKNKQMGLAKLLATIISSTLIIALAEHGFGLWSLVIGKLLNSTVQFFFLLYVSKFRPKFSLNKEHTKELISFCLPLLWMTIMSFVHRKASNIFAGIVLGPVSFALLAAAKKGEMVINEVTMSSINSMVVPAFSRATDASRVGALFIKLVTITASLVFPIFMGLAAVADPFIVVAFGDKFEQSSIYMTISAFMVFPSILAWFLPNLLISQALTKQAFHLTLLNVVSNLTIVSCTIWFGIETMLFSLVIGALLMLPIRYKIVLEHIDINVLQLMKSIFPPSLSSLLMFTSVVAAKHYLATQISNDVLLLVALVLLGGLTYPLFSLLLFRESTLSRLREIKSMLSKNKG
jgi:O-antigen/teichoic acid export membrane protein